MIHETLLPPGWPRPRGYANGVRARGDQIFLGGQIGWDETGAFKDGFAAQFDQALANILAVLAVAGAGPAHVVRMTWFVVDLAAYRAALPEIGAVYRARMGANYPAMSVIGVSGLVEPQALVEIEATAVI